MSNKKKNKKSAEIIKSEKYLSYCTMGGLILGVIFGIIICYFTENLFWLALSPVITLFLGIAVGSILGKPKKNTKKA